MLQIIAFLIMLVLFCGTSGGALLLGRAKPSAPPRQHEAQKVAQVAEATGTATPALTLTPTPAVTATPTLVPESAKCADVITRLSIKRSEFESGQPVNLVAETKCGKLLLQSFKHATREDLAEAGVPGWSFKSLLGENRVYLVRWQVTNGLSVSLAAGISQATCQNARGAREACLARSVSLPSVTGDAQLKTVQPGASTEAVSVVIVSTKWTRGTISRIDMSVPPVGLIELTVND